MIRVLASVLLTLAVAGCSGPILANPPAQRPVATAAPDLTPLVRPDPQPVEIPRDDAPHDRLTEWWYYTGHLAAGDGRRFGFEYVIFRAERGGFPVTWASHLALTDETGGRFAYAQRTEIGPQVAVGSEEAFDFTLAAPPGGTPWEMRGGSGRDSLAARATAEESGGPAIGVSLRLATDRPVVLHDRDGWIDFGPAGGSYYYSRTRMDAVGAVLLEGQTIPVRGTAWFDHQWGDFIAVGGGGWDWFAINLEDGTDLTLSLVRDRDGTDALVYGTLVEPSGRVRHLPREAFTVTETADWTSPDTGATYPAGWRIEVPEDGLLIELRPTVAEQELDTRATTGVVYWEGSQVVEATRDGQPLGGEAYVELTGYGAADTARRSAGSAGSVTPAASARSRAVASMSSIPASTSSIAVAAPR